jgi:hypothetical protein
MSARNCISTVTVPSPSQTSQRPPGTLKEKAPGPKPLRLASGWAAKSARTSSKALIYVTGFDEYDVVEMLRAGEGAIEVCRLGLGGALVAIECLHEGAIEYLVDERGFA